MNYWSVGNTADSLDTLFKYLETNGFNPKYVKHDKHNFSRTIMFYVSNQSYLIEWYKNECTLMFTGTVPSPIWKFKYIIIDSNYPSKYNQLMFPYRKLKQESRFDPLFPYDSFRIPIAENDIIQ